MRPSAGSHHQRGLELLNSGQPGPALAELELALGEDAGNHEILKSLGNAHKAMGDLERAVHFYRQSLKLQPAYAPALYNLGLALHETNRLEEAEETFRRLHSIAPADAEALAHLGAIQCKRLRFADAVQTFRKARDVSPDDPNLRSWLADAHCELGAALFQAGRLAEAIESLRKAIELQPEHAAAHHNLGNVQSMKGARAEAMRCYETALRLRPGDPIVAEAMLSEAQRICEWGRFEELSAIRRRSVFEGAMRPANPFSLLSIASTRAEQLQCARDFAQNQLAAVAQARSRFDFDRKARGKLRIGYLAGDFHKHPVACLIAELFELHDRSRFEVVAYSYGPDDGSPIRARLKRAFDRFTDIAPLSDVAAANAIHAGGADILVDLSGYTQYGRTGIVALRPAPVQVNYLGYPGTMGAEFIDYLVADRFLIPAGHAADYSEKLVLLPGSYQVNDRKRAVAATPSRRELGLPENGFVFCCFNHTYKILPETFSVWMRLLKAVPGSILWLLESNPWAGENLRREAGARGVDPGRLVFAPTLPMDRHLGRLAAADLFLDTTPYNAHTTTSDALWAGLPVLTAPGDTFASRVAGSLLSAVGLPELIAGSMEDYEALALQLARERERLAALRGKLARNRATAPLFDTPRFARNLESAYEIMWRQYQSGDGPRAIEL